MLKAAETVITEKVEMLPIENRLWERRPYKEYF